MEELYTTRSNLRGLELEMTELQYRLALQAGTLTTGAHNQNANIYILVRYGSMEWHNVAFRFSGHSSYRNLHRREGDEVQNKCSFSLTFDAHEQQQRFFGARVLYSKHGSGSAPRGLPFLKE